MTTRVVADDILGKITRKLWDLLRRVLEGSVTVERASFFIQRGIENPPATKRPGPGEGAIYILESCWCYDKANYEFATITIEWGGEETLYFEDLFRAGLSPDNRRYLMGILRRVFEAQIPDHGSRRMMRLYRVGYRNCFGEGYEGPPARALSDIHFSLEQICEFGEHGDLVPIGTN